MLSVQDPHHKSDHPGGAARAAQDVEHFPASILFVFARTGPSRLVGRFRSVLRFRGTSGGVFRALLVFADIVLWHTP